MSTDQFPRITVIQSSPDVPMDLFASRWEPHVRLILAFAGEDVPTPAEAGDGLVVLGGQMSAYDDDAAPWLPATRTLLADAARSDLPTLAICLGAQLLAVAGGGCVQVSAPPGREAGLAAVRWRDAAADDPVLGPVVAAAGAARVSGFVSMHADAVVELPADAVWLGASAMYPYQAFRLGSALGVQFHPEASVDLARRWADGHDDVDTDALVAELARHAEGMASAGALLADAFLAQVRERAATLPR